MPKRLSVDEIARLQAQAEALQLWEHARGHHVGPLTTDGKRKSAMRGYRHGMRSLGGVAMLKWLASLQGLLVALKG
jgi:hypothetical protein